MFAVSVEIWWAAAGVPVVGVTATWAAKAFGRWIGRALKATMHDAVTELVSPDIKAMGDSLGASLDALRAENARDHAEVAARLNALEARMALVESRLTIPPSALSDQEDQSS